MHTEILRVLVGSYAHGLANDQSDQDYRGVFIEPTREILALGNISRGRTRRSVLFGNNIDDTTWELGHFLHLATKSNPTALEVFLASTCVVDTPLGQRVRALFPHVWNSHDVFNAFTGYAYSGRSRMIDMEEPRVRGKGASTWLRTLYNGWELLSTGTFSVDIRHTEIYPLCMQFRAWEIPEQDIWDICRTWELKMVEAYKANQDKQTDPEPVNELLLEVRKEYW